MTVIAEYGQILLILACVFGLFMAWGVGANDVANAMGTSVGSKALTIKQAIFVAMIFEFLGAYLAGGAVTSTIRKGIVDPAIMAGTPELLVYGMLSALLAAGTWLLIASILGWPVSTTHSIVGAIVGFAAIGISTEAVAWGKVLSIVASWVVSPMLAGTIAFFIFRSVQRLILNTEDPFTQARRYIPFYMFAVGFLIAMVTLLKGLKHVFKDSGFSLSFLESMLIAGVIGGIVCAIGVVMLRRVEPEQADSGNRFASVEKMFAVLMIFTACAMAFAHGSNDVANAVGPMAAVINVVKTGSVTAKSAMPSWVLLIGGVGIVIGLATYGFKVMATIGKKITELTPSRGFAAELAAAATVVLASGTGLPISTTHTLVGAVLGVGLARGIGALNLGVVGSIFMSWVVTLPAGAGLAILFFFFFKGIFG
ncbi:anion permease [Gilvimarinus sp. SDUM040013]|uniref:Phosphate transporter n=1 Tax=Gilvimarinus gilvus TaxID=3058038 RepID=A0ABU4RYD1_9GAMM|nr:inorganic phosphate transporter [Gilvimarinus sp. SDUM040013]MDO3387409.1 anion permease [Gilvimarinus sp. SDUM040013]MDX6849886.1 inorganic phosphate transporter [Gilvimarinus sp. SDUM040013]